MLSFARTSLTLNVEACFFPHESKRILSYCPSDQAMEIFLFPSARQRRTSQVARRKVPDVGGRGRLHVRVWPGEDAARGEVNVGLPGLERRMSAGEFTRSVERKGETTRENIAMLVCFQDGFWIWAKFHAKTWITRHIWLTCTSPFFFFFISQFIRKCISTYEPGDSWKEHWSTTQPFRPGWNSLTVFCSVTVMLA